MSEQNYRTVGAIAGLVLGIMLMRTFGLGGIIPGAVFGAGGCVAGAIAAEKFYQWNSNRGG